MGLLISLKMKYYRESSIRALKGFLNVLAYLGLLPIYDFDNQTFKHVTRSRIYSFLFGFLMVIFNSISVYWRMEESWVFANKTLVLLDTLKQICLSITNSLAILELNFFKTRALSRFFALFLSVDERLRKYPKKKSYEGRGVMILELSLNSLFCLYTIVQDAHFWVSLYDLENQLPFVFEYFQYYHINIVVLFMYNLAISLKYRFQRLGGILSALGLRILTRGVHNGGVYLKTVNIKPLSFFGEVKYVREIYNDLGDLVDLFNEIFGWLIGWITNVILISLLIVIEGYMLQKKEIQIMVEYNLLVVMGLLYALMFAVLLAVSCEKATKEAQNVGTISYKLLARIDRTPETAQIREELFVLAQQATHRCPYFSAAGFFNVDYTMLFIILGSFTSYLVVIIQFNKF